MEKGNEELGLWLKPGMFFSIAEISDVKEECARFLDWFLNSEEANDILNRERLLQDESLPKSQREMFQYVDGVMPLCGAMPPPEPAGMEALNEIFAETANKCFYGVQTPDESAAEFRRRAEEVLSAVKNE